MSVSASASPCNTGRAGAEMELVTGSGTGDPNGGAVGTHGQQKSSGICRQLKSSTSSRTRSTHRPQAILVMVS